MPTTFLVVPQWQGSGSSRAMRLIDGAESIAGDLPAASTLRVDIPSGAGSNEGTAVQRLSSLRLVRDALRARLATVAGAPIVIGGDCGVDLASIEHAMSRHDNMALVWLDAHADLNTPESSPSGAFHGMVVRTLLGDGPGTLVPRVPLRADRLVYGGLRSVDDGEQEYLSGSAARVLPPEELRGETIAAALQETGATSAYLHIDLDVLDPAAINGIGYPEPFGVELDTLLDVVTAVRGALPLAGAAITEFAPASEEAASDDLGSILRVLGALTR